MVLKLSTLYFLASSISTILLYCIARRKKARFYAYYTLILCGIQTVFSTICFARNDFPLFPPWVYMYLQVAYFIQYFMLLKPKLRPLWYRLIISYPGYWYMGATWVSLFLTPLRFFFGYSTISALIAFAIASFGLYQSLFNHNFGEIIDIDLRNREDLPTLQRCSTKVPEKMSDKILTIFQITDPHIGPFMSIERLRNICQRVVDMNPQPDLVLLTGDYYTVDAHSYFPALSEALLPLRQMKGKCFACMGNHDYEAPESVRQGLKDNGIILLEDEATIAKTACGPIQIIGSIHNFSSKTRKQQQITKLLNNNPPILDGKRIPRIMLLHNPSVFRLMPNKEVDLTLCGHYHGGQIGLLSLGVNWTVMKIFEKYPLKDPAPENGLWGFGTNRMYAHRGTGHYGFPLRIGVPSEQSLLRIHL